MEIPDVVVSSRGISTLSREERKEYAILNEEDRENRPPLVAKMIMPKLIRSVVATPNRKRKLSDKNLQIAKTLPKPSNCQNLQIATATMVEEARVLIETAATR